MGWIKGFKREVVYGIEPLRSDWHRFFPILASNAGYKIKEVKTTFYPRIHGKSKFGRFGIMRIPGAFFDTAVLKFHLSFSKKPMHLFGMLGIISFFLGFLTGLYIIYLNFVVGNVVNRVPLIILTALFILVGIQFFATGFLAEFMASIKELIERKEK
jgi:hypothetical protein